MYVFKRDFAGWRKQRLRAGDAGLWFFALSDRIIMPRRCAPKTGSNMKLHARTACLFRAIVQMSGDYYASTYRFWCNGRSRPADLLASTLVKGQASSTYGRSCDEQMVETSFVRCGDKCLPPHPRTCGIFKGSPYITMLARCAGAADRLRNGAYYWVNYCKRSL